MEIEAAISFETPCADMENGIFGWSATFKKRDSGNKFPVHEGVSERNFQSPCRNERYDAAALKLQKVYKSFRTRRQLADCAVIVEQRCKLMEYGWKINGAFWWKLLDFAELKRSSISFFDVEKPETAVSRWSRARTRAAKVGKGLSKDEKARKLALQHWLEAIDPRHRYGHNLQFYYLNWLYCESSQPFFYWLDIGEGKEVNLERCPRPKLQHQCIKYLGPIERKAYEVGVENGKFFYTQSGKLLHTVGGSKDDKWIFVLSTSKTLFVGLKCKGRFQHSSFLAGGATLSAGRLVVDDGILKAVWPHSGHYLPTEENFQELISFLREHNVDLTKVKKCPSEEEEADLIRRDEDVCQQSEVPDANSIHNSTTDNGILAQGNNGSRYPDSNSLASRSSDALHSNITKLEIPERNDVFDFAGDEDGCPDSASEDGYETAEEALLSDGEFMKPKMNLFDEDQEEDEEPIPEEKIKSRIVLHKRTRSYQLAQQLSSKWTTGAGPRIGCMRDYPSELQFRVLEQAHLSPRASNLPASPHKPYRFSHNASSPTPSCRGRGRNAGRRSSLAPPEQVMR